MAIIAKGGGESTFVPAPEGVHRAICVDVIDKGMITSEWDGQKRELHKVVIRWLIDAVKDDSTPYSVDGWYTLSLSEKANLRRDLEAWRGRQFTAEELNGFDLEKLIGANCQLVVIHAHKGDRVYANVKGIMPLAKGMEKLALPGDYVREKDRSQNGAQPKKPWEEEDDDLPF